MDIILLLEKFDLFWKDLTVRTLDVFSGSRLLSIMLLVTCILFFSSNKVFAVTPNDEEYAPFAEEMSSPVGGIEGLVKNVHYPDMARKAGVQGRVFILVYVNEHGGVDDVKVVKGIGAGCDEAAIAAAKKTKFSPGKSKGQSIKTKLSLAINFKL
jgi:protein TonB